jgi:hypothetical protein
LFIDRKTRALQPNLGCATGLSFGLVISPASLDLYALYFVPYYVGLVLGMLGLISSFVHGVPGVEAAKVLGLIHTIVNTQETVTIEVINGLCWGIVYGALVMPAATGRVI